MTTMIELRFRMDHDTRRLLEIYRRQHGDATHAAACLGGIDGIASSLADATGPRNAAEALYRAADAMVTRHERVAIQRAPEASEGYCSIWSAFRDAFTRPRIPRGR